MDVPEAAEISKIYNKLEFQGLLGPNVDPHTFVAKIHYKHVEITKEERATVKQALTYSRYGHRNLVPWKG
jgi:hypothetical protein